MNAPGSETTTETEEPLAPTSGSKARASVVVLGTSITAGMGLADPGLESWPAQLQVLADEADLAVEVRNAGVSGDTSAGGLRRLQWILREPLDVLVIELGANDGLRGLSLADLEGNLRRMIEMAREANPDVAVALAAMEAPPNLGVAYTTDFREVFPRVAATEEVALIPFLLEGVAGEPSLNQADAIHPTAAGHVRVARNAWRTLESILTTASERIARAETS